MQTTTPCFLPPVPTRPAISRGVQAKYIFDAVRHFMGGRTAAAEARHRTARIPAVPRLAQCRLSAGASPHAGTCIPSHARRADASGPSGSADFARRGSIWRRPSRWIRSRRRRRRCTAPPVPGVDGARTGGDATARWVRFVSARRARSSWRRAGWRSYASRHDVDLGHGGCAAQVQKHDATLICTRAHVHSAFQRGPGTSPLAHLARFHLLHRRRHPREHTNSDDAIAPPVCWPPMSVCVCLYGLRTSPVTIARVRTS